MTQKHWWGLGIVTVACLIAAPLAIAEKGSKEKFKDVEHMMERVHEGKNSPYKSSVAQLKTDKPNWDLLMKNLPDLKKMADLMKNHKSADIKDSSDTYVEGVQALGEAVGKKNLDGAKAAIKKLENACGDCHYKGGVGGKLD